MTDARWGRGLALKEDVKELAALRATAVAADSVDARDALRARSGGTSKSRVDGRLCVGYNRSAVRRELLLRAVMEESVGRTTGTGGITGVPARPCRREVLSSGHLIR